MKNTMTQISKKEYKKAFDLKSLWSFATKKFPDYFTTVVVVGLILGAYSAFSSKDYWIFIWTKIKILGDVLWSLFSHSKDYLLANLFLLAIVLFAVSLFKQKSWIEKIQYNQNAHTNFYISQLLQRGNAISTEEEFMGFGQDVVDFLHNIFTQKSNVNSATWLKPDGSKLELFFANKKSKYSDENTHYSFSADEGVIGNSWKQGKTLFYSEKQENQFYVSRIQCSDKAYICRPILEEPLNKYGVIAIGSGEDIFWGEEDIETLKLFATIISMVLNNLDNGIKTQFNLSTS